MPAENPSNQNSKRENTRSATNAVTPTYVITQQDIERAGRFELLGKEMRLDINDSYFDGVAKSQKIKDEDFVTRKELQFRSDDPKKKEAMAIGGALEYLVAKRISDGMWFGQGLKAQLASRFDDIRNGIDMYIEHIGNDDETSDEPVGINIDATTGITDPLGRGSELEGKLLDYKLNYLDHGKRPQLSYYRPLSEKTRKKYIAENRERAVLLPKLVIGISKERTLQALENFEKNPKDPDLSTAFIVIFQIERQLEAYAEYSRQRGTITNSSSKLNVAREYEKALSNFRKNLPPLMNTPEARELIAKIAKKEAGTINLLNSLDKLLKPPTINKI
jgi:hypothetical protein